MFYGSVCTGWRELPEGGELLLLKGDQLFEAQRKGLVTPGILGMVFCRASLRRCRPCAFFPEPARTNVKAFREDR